MTRTRWSVLAAYVLVTSANQLLWLTYAPIDVAVAHRYGVDKATVGLLSLLFPLLYVVLAIPAGGALDRSFRRTLLLGAWLTAAGGLLRLVGDSFTWAVVGQLVAAVAQPLVASALTKVATVWTTDEDRPLGIAVGSAGLSLGFVLAFATAGILGEEHLRLLLALQAAYAVLGALALTAAVRGPSRDVVVPLVVGRAALRQVWADPVTRVTTGLVVVGFGVFVALTTYLQPLLEKAGTTDGQVAALLLVMVVAGIVGSLVLPPLVTRRHAERSVLVLALVVGSAGCLLLAVVHAVVGVGLVLGVMGFFLLATLPVVFELTESRAGEHSGTAASLLWMAGNAGGLVVAVVVGVLVESPVASFVLLAVVALLGLPVLARLRLPSSSVAGAPAATPAPAP